MVLYTYLKMHKARYVPFASGRYEIAAGLRPLGTDFGNGELDQRVFQVDADYDGYIAVKDAGRAERLEKYYPKVAPADVEVVEQIAEWIGKRLALEYPERDWARSTRTCRDPLDTFASQIQEDVAIFRRDPEDPQREWLAAIHLSFPNHWAAEDKIGQSFNTVHAPVAGFEKLARAKDGLIEMMVTKGPFVRFAWGVATDRELNHHPKNSFQGRAFDPADPKLYVRVERQTLTAFPQVQASLFTIRTSFLDVATELSDDEREALARAIESMSPEQLRYKGLIRSRVEVLTWIRNLSGKKT